MKYPSIINTYEKKQIHKWTQCMPELESCHYIVTEKIHGANMSIYVNSDGAVRYGRRKDFLIPGEQFNNYETVMMQYAPFIETLKEYVKGATAFTTLTLYGEIFGGRVQKGVKYGETVRFRVFGMAVDGELRPPIETEVMMIELGFEDLLVPQVSDISSLEKAMAVDSKFISRLGPQDDEKNICEGVVIRPYDRVFRMKSGAVFALKKKNEEFKERHKAPAIPSEHGELTARFKEYIVRARLLNVVSKYQSLDNVTKEDFSKYAKLVMEDAKEEFMREYGDEVNEKLPEKQQQRKLFGRAGALIYRLIREEFS